MTFVHSSLFPLLVIYLLFFNKFRKRDWRLINKKYTNKMNTNEACKSLKRTE